MYVNVPEGFEFGLEGMKKQISEGLHNPRGIGLGVEEWEVTEKDLRDVQGGRVESWVGWRGG